MLLRRIHSFLGVFVLILPLVTASLSLLTPGAIDEEQGISNKGNSNDGEDLSTPRFALVEEHHHVVNHLVRFAREGFLRSHIDAPSGERNPNGAIVVHIDSHADMGLTVGLNHLPAESLFSELPPENTDADYKLVRHSIINDFLLLLGYMGIVDHIIFVEPTWSLLLSEAHYTTVDISIGVVPGDATYGSIRNSPDTIFSSEPLDRDTLDAFVCMMDDDDEPVEIVPHEELLRHCGNERCNLRTVRFTTLPYKGSAKAIRKILELDGNKDRDVVLDIDLDGFSTTSPGALSLLQTTIPDYNVLTRIYHTFHDGSLCDMETADYWERLKARENGGGNSSSGTHNDDDDDDDDDDDEIGGENNFCKSNHLSFAHGPRFRPPMEDDSLAYNTTIVSDRAWELLEKSSFYYLLDEDAEQALGDVFEYYLPIIDASVYDDEKFAELLDTFLLQPFFVPESKTVKAVLDFHFDHLFRSIFASGVNPRTPKVIQVVRSPFYTPDHHLDFIECEVFDRLLDMFGNNNNSNDNKTSTPTLYHGEDVLVDRTNCLHEPKRFPPRNRLNIGAHPDITIKEWEQTGKTFAWFFEETDDLMDQRYKNDPISVDFANEHNHTLLVSTADGESHRLLPKEELTWEVDHLEKWKIFRERGSEPAKVPFSTIFFDGKNGHMQSYGSISGRAPVHDSTPVRMEFHNPSDSGIRVAFLWRTSEGHEDHETAHRFEGSLAPGQTQTVLTYHGTRWSIHEVDYHDDDDDDDDGYETVPETNRLGEVIANATYGETHSVHLFSDPGTAGNEL